MDIISEFENSKDQIVRVAKDDNNQYSVTVDDNVVQPDHDADGIIRYLSNYIYAMECKMKKMNNQT